MQLRTVAIAFAISCLSAVASAADVCYQFVADDESMDVAAENSIDPNLAIVDRDWIVPGLEQSDKYPIDSFAFGRSRPEATVERIVFLRHRDDEMSSNAQDPIWDKNDLWPRTREMWQRGEYYRRFRLEKPEVFYLGHIGLQR